VGTILAVDVFLGALLGVSVIQYNRQTAHVKNYVQPVMSGMVQTVGSKNVFTMTSSTYDIFYYVAQIVLPSLGSLYFALAMIWGFPYGEQIVGTIALVDAFLGIFLGISTAQHKKVNSETPA
jgi:hypothetical protein